MRTLVPGERVEVAGAIVLSLDVAVRPPLALALIAFGADRRQAADFAPVDTQTRELRLAAAFAEDGTLRLDLPALPDTVARLVLVAFLVDGPGGRARLRDLGAMTLSVGDAVFPIALEHRADTALILAELYRHRGGWRLAANGQGFVGGLVALADACGADRAWAGRLVAGPDDGSRRAPAGRGEALASGSGVAVEQHHLLTNAHVVDGAGCVSVTGDGRSAVAELVFADPRNDLALLRVATPLPAVAAFRGGAQLHLGEDVVALGYPLQGLLGSGPQASAGNIAALSGIGNDTTLFQFSAPIASGNSGGPVLDSGGLMVGLVSSSLDLDRVRAGGNSAENVNFAIKAAVVMSFLDAFGLAARIGEPAPAQARAATVRSARASLYRVTCE